MIRYELGDIATFQEQCPVLPNFPVINPEVTRTRDEYVTGSGQKVFPIFAKARFLKYKGLKDYQVILFADTILFMYSSIAPLTREQQVEVTEDVGKSFMFDHPVEVLRLDQEQLFSHWKRKVFYKSAKPMFDIAEFSSLDLEDLL
jgi:phenylacetate-coenzyme A ligase PaaK-like adenylate-forming protein